MGIFSLLKKSVDVVGDVADIVVAPVEIAVDVTSAIVKPVADEAREIVEDISDDLKD